MHGMYEFQPVFPIAVLLPPPVASGLLSLLPVPPAFPMKKCARLLSVNAALVFLLLDSCTQGSAKGILIAQDLPPGFTSASVDIISQNPMLH